MKSYRFALAFTALLTALLLTGPSALSQESEPVSAAQMVEKWLTSAHADAAAEAFTHWDEEGEIPGSCATCHSGEGFRDFVAGDMSTPGVIDHPVETGGVVDCETCHNEATEVLTTVTFPSGVQISDLGKSAICMTCHQGRTSAETVNMSVAELGDDEVNPDLGFVNVHYRAAAATQRGGEVHGGYEYAGKTYMGLFAHVPTAATCVDCHDPHALEVEVELCVGCHQTDDPAAIRTSQTDFDGDGDMSEGIAAEIDMVHDALRGAITAYSAEVSGIGAVYASSYPYWFADTNGDGEAGEDETVFPNSYKSWTPRLLKAAYNYHYVVEDPGAFAHNPHYVLQILYDSIEDLGQSVSVDMAALTRP